MLNFHRAQLRYRFWPSRRGADRGGRSANIANNTRRVVKLIACDRGSNADGGGHHGTKFRFVSGGLRHVKGGEVVAPKQRSVGWPTLQILRR
jgi:hypothetical protein